MSKLTITVAGQPGVGKSAIAQALSEFLEESGFVTRLNFINDEHPPRTQDELQNVLDSVRNRIEIDINEMSALR
jgi:predicted PilT family ATPase